jgi:hypothetical protein
MKTDDKSTISLAWIQTKKDSNKGEHFKQLRVLFDSGCAATLVNHTFLNALKKKSALNTK